MSSPFIRKLETFGPLPDRDRRALTQAMTRTRQVDAGRALVLKGDHPAGCQLILQGFAHRHRVLENGQRRIMSFEIPGDLCDLHGFLLGQASHTITALTPCKVATLPREDFPVMASSEYSANFSAPAPLLRRLFDKSRFAISTEETRYYLNGVYMHVADGADGRVLRCVATDGHRLARIDAGLPEGAEEYALDDDDAAARLTPIDHGDVCVNIDDTWFADNDVEPPATLDDLVDPTYEGLFVTPGATTSSPGLAFLLATIAEHGEEGVGRPVGANEQKGYEQRDAEQGVGLERDK